MITGTTNTGDVIQRELLQMVSNNDMETFAHLQSNNFGPSRNTVAIAIIPYRGGPLIARHTDGSLQVNHVRANGFSATVVPNNTPLLPTLNSDVKSTVNVAASNSLIDIAIKRMLGM